MVGWERSKATQAQTSSCFYFELFSELSLENKMINFNGRTSLTIVQNGSSLTMMLCHESLFKNFKTCSIMKLVDLKIKIIFEEKNLHHCQMIPT